MIYENDEIEIFDIKGKTADKIGPKTIEIKKKLGRYKNPRRYRIQISEE